MPELKEWTVMVFLAGDNNLSEDMLYSLKEMKLAGTSPEVAVVAQFDSNEPGLPTQRFVLNAGAGSTPSGVVEKDFVEFVDVETNSGDKEVVADFIAWAVRTAPARHYLVVFSGHGSQAEEGFLLSDDNPLDAIDLAELKQIFPLAKEKLDEAGMPAGTPGVPDKFDILGLDSCLMSGAEVCYQLREHVSLCVGPEGFEPNTGWPYRQIVGRVIRQPAITPPELAAAVVDEYVRYYYDYILTGRSVEMAACDLAYADDLRDAVRGLAAQLRGALPDGGTEKFDGTNAILNAVVLAHWDAQGFKFDQYCDLYDFCDRLQTHLAAQAGAPAQDIKTACEAVKRAVRDGQPGQPARRFVTRSCYSGPTFQYAFGLSIFLPWFLPTPAEYRALDFVVDTEWNTFVDKYVLHSRRASRPGVEPFPVSFDSPGKSRGPDKPGTMKNSPRKWNKSQRLVDLINAPAADAGAGGEES